MKLDENIELIAEIGTGGMGSVWRASHAVMKKDVAVKLLRKNLLTAERLLRFRQEAQLASSLNHRNIIQIYSFGKSEEMGPYIVMELVEGESLDRRLQRSLLTAAEFTEVFEQCCQALQFAHDGGIIHRDIKPGNIMLTPDGDTLKVKVGDFGIAKFLDESRNIQHLTQTGEIVGSPHYISPESCLGQSIDARSDVYSLGCVMYEALTGLRPFSGENACEVMINHTKGQFDSQRLNKVDVGLKDIVLTCMSLTPESRQQSMSEVYEDLRAGKPSGSPVRNNLEKKKLDPHRLRKRSFIAMACGLVLLAGGYSYMYFKNAQLSPDEKLIQRKNELLNANSDKDICERASIWLQLGNHSRAYEDYRAIVHDAAQDLSVRVGRKPDRQPLRRRNWTDHEITTLIAAAKGCDSTQDLEENRDHWPWDELSAVVGLATQQHVWKIASPMTPEQQAVADVMDSKAANLVQSATRHYQRSVIRDDMSRSSLALAAELERTSALIYMCSGKPEIARQKEALAAKHAALAEKLKIPDVPGINFN